METAVRPLTFVAGENDPSPVTHVIGLDYYDGVTSGLLKTADGSAFAFDTVDEAHRPDGPDRRTFELRPLPAGAFDRLAAALEEHLTPNWPCWVPVWAFPTDDARRAADAEVDRALALAGEPRWRVEGAAITERVCATPLA